MNPTTDRTSVEALRFGYGETRIGTVLVAQSDRVVAAILLGDDRAKLRRERVVKADGSIPGYRWGVQR